MSAVFTHPTFKVVLERLTVQNTAQILWDWNNINRQKAILENAMALYGRGTTKPMSNCIVLNNLNHTTLEEMYQNCSSEEEFCDLLHKAGVKMKLWREKIWQHFAQQK